MKKICIKALLFCFLTFFLSAQTIDMDQIRADEEFRIGVVAFHQGYFNKAILALERSLVFKPENPLVRQWLGRAYYQSGYEDAALNEWDNLIDTGAADSALLSFRDMVDRRRGVMVELREPDEWVEILKLQNDRSGAPLLGRPTSVSASENGRGWFYTVSFASNLISIFNPNGDRLNQFNGGVDGFAHPFDILVLDNDHFLVSEYDGDRISLCNDLGYRQLSIGESGRGDGHLLGPQFMTRSGEYFYVSDWGNKEVDKYSIEGEFIFSFGKRNGDFPGFQGPSGLALTPYGLVVSDSLAQAIYLFDENGNFLKTLINEGLEAPEGLSYIADGSLLIADGNRVLSYRFESNASEILYVDDQGDSRILKVNKDENGNLLIPDFNKNNLRMLTGLSTLYGGLFLRIDRIDSHNYPEVFIDFSLEDAYGNPYVGLDESNFLVKEQENYLGEIELVAAGYLNRNLRMNLLLEESPTMRSQADQVAYALSDFLQRKEQGDEFNIIAASELPYIIAQDDDNPFQKINESWLSSTTTARQWQFDTSLRMAATALVESNDRRVIVYFSSGELRDDAFDTYGLVESASYLRNNNILFYPVYFSTSRRSEELEYLAEQSGGESYFSLDPQGVGRLMDQSRRIGRSDYRLRYESHAQNDFGRNYIPLILEISYLRKSGRDELGYFSPIDYEPTR